jgi:hypothetical protein
MATVSKEQLEANIRKLLTTQLAPELQSRQKMRSQLENNIRALLKNKSFLDSITKAQTKTLENAVQACQNQQPGMFSKLWQSVLGIMNGLLEKKENTPENVDKITEIHRIIYHSLIHPNSNDLANIDILVTTKGFGWKDELDAVDNQLALLKLTANDKKVAPKLVNKQKQRITYKKRVPTVDGEGK